MSKRVCGVSLALLMLATLLAGCSSGGEGTWHGRDLDATDPPWTSHEVAPGQTYEIDFNDQKAGERLTWDWFVDEQVAVEFGVHSHRSGNVLTLQRANQVEDTGGLDIDRDGKYSMTWTNNQDGPITVWFRVPEGWTLP